MPKKKRRKKKRTVPKAYIYVDKTSRTVATRNKKTGRLTGRRKTRSPGDKTRVRRVKKGKYKGHIFGRTTRIRASKNRKGTRRRL